MTKQIKDLTTNSAPALTDMVPVDRATTFLTFKQTLQAILDLFSGTAEVFTGIKTFGAAGNVGKLKIAGTTSGTTILDATAAASGTLTLPAATDTLVGKATTDTLTNKTLTTPTINNFTNANHTHAASGATGGVVANASLLAFGNNGISPADASTYYTGAANSIVSPSTTANLSPIIIPSNGTIFRIDVFFVVSSVLGTTETFTTSFRLNNTTDTVISASCKLDAAQQTFSNSGLAIAVAAGDTCEIKCAFPTWATNPTGVRITAHIFMR